MWKVSNNLNTPVLSRYSDFISRIFELIIDISRRPDKANLLLVNDFLVNEFRNANYLNERILEINKNANDRIKTLIEEIILLEYSDLVAQYDIYKYQNSEILKGNYNISEEIHPDCLKKLFKDYFYTIFFGIDWIWTEIIGKDYQRDMFKSDFKDENNLFVCPYCDSDTISNSRNGWIEHFLPKGKFPFISCNPLNLIPSCTACNVSGSGKGEDVKNPITNQYLVQIGDELEFEFLNGEIVIKENEVDAIENFIQLLKLRSRYKEQNVKSRVLSSLKLNYNIVKGGKGKNEFDKDEFFQFIHDSGRNSGLYFVQKDLLNYIDDI